MVGGEISADDPRAEDVRALLRSHHLFARSHSPAAHVYALDVDGLIDPAITFFSLRSGGTLLAVGALKQLDPMHAELKSMHTAEAARRSGVGRAMLGHLVGVARDRCCRPISLQTGSAAAFEPARALYASAGFRPCAP